MTSAANTNMANISRPGHSYTVFSEARMMQKVGEDLRSLYGDMIDRSAPDELLRLARNDRSYHRKGSVDPRRLSASSAPPR
ncbi:hypothetical protein EON79_23115, partial [bacterium]